MTVSSVSGVTSGHYDAVSNASQPQSAPKQQTQLQQDTVKISQAAQAKQSQTSGDVDHDVDSH